MGTDIQRTILLVFFGFSLFLLWDRWHVYNGKPPMFGPAPAPQVTAPPQAATGSRGACRASGSRVPEGTAPKPPHRRGRRGAVDAPPAASAKSPPVVVETDLMRASIDPVGAVLSRVELLQADGRARLDGEWTDWPGHWQAGTKRTRPRRAARSRSAARLRRAKRNRRRRFFRITERHLNRRRRAAPAGRRAGQVDVSLQCRERRRARDEDYTFHRGRYDAEVKHEIVNVELISRWRRRCTCS